MPPKPKSPKKPQQSASPEAIRQGLLKQVHRTSSMTGRISFAAVPSLSDEHVAICAAIFKAAGRPFGEPEYAHARKIFREQGEIAFLSSSRSHILVTWEAARGRPVNYQVEPIVSSVEKEYENWIATRDPPFFGKEPDARVMAVAAELTAQGQSPSGLRVLDIGAGPGRNALPLARLGHPVDAVELTGQLAQELVASAEKEDLPVRVVQKEFASAVADLTPGYHFIFLSEVVSDFRGPAQLRLLFEACAQLLAPGGRLLFNLHLAHTHYTPDKAAREISQQVYSTLYTRADLTGALDGLGFELESDVSVHDYEEANLPPGVFPQTGWYVDWVKCGDIFGMPNPPAEMRWLAYKKL